MTPLTAAELLSVWERGLQQSAPRRALLLLDAAAAGPDIETLSELPLGDRDALLLALRALMFGNDITALSDCPACGATMELNFVVGDVLVQQPLDQTEHHTACFREYRVTFRSPTAGDAVWLAESESENELTRALLERCVISAFNGDASVTAGDLPDEVVTMVSAQMEQVDPQADIQLQCCCADCGRRWSSAFDVPSFLLTEAEAAVRRILIEVHTLASAYGWRESDILNMSARRRGLYLEMVNG